MVESHYEWHRTSTWQSNYIEIIIKFKGSCHSKWKQINQLLFFFQRKTLQDSLSSPEYPNGEQCQLLAANPEVFNQIETCDLSIGNMLWVDGPTNWANTWGLVNQLLLNTYEPTKTTCVLCIQAREYKLYIKHWYYKWHNISWGDFLCWLWSLFWDIKDDVANYVTWLGFGFGKD